jgi:hypothetical protein
MKGIKVIKVLQNGHMQRGLIVNYGASARYIFTTKLQKKTTLQFKKDVQASLELEV